MSVLISRRFALKTYILAFKIQSRSSSPSSGPPGPPLTCLNNLGCQSTPSSALLAASSLCISSIFVFSSVATIWFCSLTAWAVLYQSFCDSRSSCSSRGRVCGGVCLDFVASKSKSLFPVYPNNQYVRITSARLFHTFISFINISPVHIPESSYRISPVWSFLIVPPMAL